MRALWVATVVAVLMQLSCAGECDSCATAEVWQQQCYCPPAGKCPEVTAEPEELQPEPDGEVGSGEEVDPEGPAPLKIEVVLKEEVLSGIAEVAAKVTGGATVLGVEFYVDTVRIDTDFIPPYNATVNTTDFPDGNHFITVFTADNAGQTATTSTAVSFDNTPPQILSTLPVGGEGLFFEDGPLAMALQVDDPSAIKSVSFRANGLLAAEVQAPPFVASVDYSSLFITLESLPKNIYLQYSVTDYLGQQAEKSFNVMVHRRLAWKFETVGEIWGGATAMTNGNIVFGNSNHKLYCLTPAGGQVWVQELDQQLLEAPAVDPANDRVFVGTANGTVYAFNSGGSQLWTKSLGTPIGGDVLFLDGKLYLSGFNGTFHCLSADSGSTQWQLSLPGQIMSSPAAGNDGRIFVGCQDKKFYAMQNGSTVWSVPTDGEIWSTPVLSAAQTVYFGSNDGWLYAIRSDSSNKWVKELGGQIWGRPLLSDDGFLFAASTSKYVTKLDSESGDQLWTTKTEGISTSSPAADEKGTVHLGTTTGRIYALDGESGVVRWTYQVGNTIHATPLVRDGKLYFGSTDRNFYALWLDPAQM